MPLPLLLRGTFRLVPLARHAANPYNSRTMKLSLARRTYRRLFPRPQIPNPPLSVPLPYDSAGQYLESASLPTIGIDVDGSGGIRFDNEGIPIVRYGDLWAHNPVTTALKGCRNSAGGNSTPRPSVWPTQ